MIGNHRVLALVLARGGSKGFLRKNLRELGGRPLVAWPISAALNSRYVDRVVLTTDDAEIAEAGRRAGADVPFMRPAELAGDLSASTDAILHALEMLKPADGAYAYCVALEPTSPFTEGADIDAALERLDRARDTADAIVGVCRSDAVHPEFSVVRTPNGTIKPGYASDFANLKRRQDVSEVYFLEGSLYISDVAAFERERSFYHQRTLPFVVPRWKAIEIDEAIDMVFAEAIVARLSELRRGPAMPQPAIGVGGTAAEVVEEDGPTSTFGSG